MLLLDWKNLGVKYSKARLLALRRAYPDAFYAGVEDEDVFDFTSRVERMANSMPASPRFRPMGMATPGDLGTLTDEVRIPSLLFQPNILKSPYIDEISGYQ